jgi:hypothetical protein
MRTSGTYTVSVSLEYLDEGDYTVDVSIAQTPTRRAAPAVRLSIGAIRVVGGISPPHGRSSE